jgi:serine/threonine protein phosphatase PrpC
MSSTTENHFLFQQELGAVTSLARSCWVASVFSQRSPEKETPNEDATVVIPLDEETAVFAVADGCGGQRGGELASSLALKCLADSIAKETDRSNLRLAIMDGIDHANRLIQELKIGAACTIAVAEFQKGWVRTYHVGDSQLLLISNRGRVRYQSVSHSPVGFAVEAGLLEPEQAIRHDDRHVISNFLGYQEMRMEIGPCLEMGSRDTLIIGSDGLFDNLFEKEVIEVMRKGRLATSLQSLTDAASERMRGQGDSPCKPDDLSVIAVRRSF